MNFNWFLVTVEEETIISTNKYLKNDNKITIQ